MKKINSIHKLAPYLIALLIAGGGYLWFAAVNHYLPFAADSQMPVGDQFVNMNKTTAEKQATKDLEDNPQNKTQNTQRDIPPPPQVDKASGKNVVSVLVTNAGVFNGKVSASGFVTDIVESDGTCEYVFSSGNSRLVKISDTLANATSTTCKTVSFSADELAASDKWEVYIEYTSSSSEGISPSKELQK